MTPGGQLIYHGPPPGFPGKGYHPIINRLRGWALLCVLVYHGGGVLGWSNTFHGEIGVDIFLILSGFILALNCGDVPAGVFLRRRFFRIFPAYWLALALFLSLDAHFLGIHRPAAEILAHIAGLHGYFHPGWMMSINDSFWFISVLVLCYAIFLPLRSHLHDLTLIVTVGAALTAVLAMYFQVTGNFEPIHYISLRIPDFFAGLVLGQVASGKGLDFRPGFRLAAALLLLTYVGVYYLALGDHMVPAFGFIIAFVSVDPLLARAAAGRWVLGGLGILGTFSYELYLLHQPLMGRYNLLVLSNGFGIARPSKWQILAGICVGLAAALLGAVILHRLVEFLPGRPGNRSGPIEPGRRGAQFRPQSK